MVKAKKEETSETEWLAEAGLDEVVGVPCGCRAKSVRDSITGHRRIECGFSAKSCG